VAEFVPPDFEVPLGLRTSEFVLEPLGPSHNEQDYEAWTSSIEHIAGTPGFPDGSWPREMTSDENIAPTCSDTPTTFATGRGSRTRRSIQ
jgi:hypothetical protein